jgi:hypothetical protein
MPDYVNNKELFAEICKCLPAKKLSPTAEKMLMLIAERAIGKLTYADEMDKEDCIAFAKLELMRYWDRFNPTKSKNAFAYYTQIAKHGYAKGWNILHPAKYAGTVSITSRNDETDGIFSL